MKILPAIDIKDGQAVRLFKGDFSQKTVVNPDVLEQARVFKEAGVTMIHVVDLDGALEGRAANRDLISQIKAETGLAIQVGGGIRSLEQIEDYLEVGIDRVIIGSMAVKNPEFVEAALERFGSRKIVIGIDAKAELVATEGWLETSNQYPALSKIASSSQACSSHCLWWHPVSGRFRRAEKTGFGWSHCGQGLLQWTN